MIESEVGEDVYLPGERTQKLALFELWLYDFVSEMKPRLAPSIIARSEAELLGISSPRFAIRVYFSGGSFANIRRRRVTARQIRVTYDEDLADQLQDISLQRKQIKNTNWSDQEKVERGKEIEERAYRKVNWIADCLLVPPKRLVDEGYKFLTCSLGEDYGEERTPEATPFVTHISIGGGLCAQAACFMAMCLLQHTEIFGISEITVLASEGKNEVEIHGLKPRTMESFFRKVGLAAQLQEGVAHESLLTNKEIELEIQKIRAALRIYVDNKIPVLLMLSASRMQGLRPKDIAPSIPKPIIVSSGDRYVKGSSEIPLGKKLDYLSSMIVEQRDLAHDNHCVVVVGRNEDASSFLINDPATFPFLKCTPAQLFDARSYRSFAKDKGIPERKLVEILEVAEKDLGRFQFLSVGPEGTNLWLLNLAGDAIPQRGGLLGEIQNSLHSGQMGIKYDIRVSQIQKLNLHLGRWSDSDGMDFRSGLRIESDFAEKLWAAGLTNNRWYWVSHIQEPDKSGIYVESFSLWDASSKWIPGIALRNLLYCVFARHVDGTWHETLKGKHGQ